MAKNWEEGGDVDGEAALTHEDGDRVEALWPLTPEGKTTDPHAHIATNDGLNASYVREEDGEVVVDDNPSSMTFTGSTSSADWNERMAGFGFNTLGGGGRRRRR